MSSSRKGKSLSRVESHIAHCCSACLTGVGRAIGGALPDQNGRLSFRAIQERVKTPSSKAISDPIGRERPEWVNNPILLPGHEPPFQF
jgi:hypothetical protein